MLFNFFIKEKIIVDNTLYIVSILIFVAIGALILKCMTLRCISFIGSRSRVYVIWYKLVCILIHTAISIGLLVVMNIEPIVVIVVTPYLLITLYIGAKVNKRIHDVMIENQGTVIVLSMVQTSLVHVHSTKESTLNCLLDSMEKVEFEITKRDALRIAKLLKDGAKISKVHYYETSTRLYGIEVLQYN